MESNRYHQWSARPTPEQIKNQVNGFLKNISVGDFEKAFYLCPIYTYRRPLIATFKNSSEVSRMLDQMFETIDSFHYLDAFKNSSAIAISDRLSWCRYITPPEEVNYELLGLDILESGDVEANVHIDKKVTSVTAIFNLLREKKKWLLAFKMFKIM